MLRRQLSEEYMVFQAIDFTAVKIQVVRQFPVATMTVPAAPAFGLLAFLDVQWSPCAQPYASTLTDGVTGTWLIIMQRLR